MTSRRENGIEIPSAAAFARTRRTHQRSCVRQNAEDHTLASVATFGNEAQKSIDCCRWTEPFIYRSCVRQNAGDPAAKYAGADSHLVEFLSYDSI